MASGRLRYTEPTFTLPTAEAGTSDLKWDYSVLSRDEFVAKHGEALYNKIASEGVK